MNLSFWNIVFLVGFIVYACIRGVFEERAKGNEIRDDRMDTLEKLLLVLMAPGSLLLPLLYLFTHWLSFADYHLPVIAQPAGAVIMIAALWIFYRSHADLGKNWSVTLKVREGHKLVTNGIYRSIRHPMYLAIWLFSLAQGLMLENWLAGWYSIVAFAVMYFVRIPREEKMMYDAFGDEYWEYVERTGRVLPRR